MEYGRVLQGYRDCSGPYRVFGTNGPIGWHTEAHCEHASVIVGRKGAYRGIHFSPSPFSVIDTAFFLKPTVEMDTRWAYYALLTQDINRMDSGSAIPSTSREDFYQLPVSVPPIADQQAIAHILGRLDDKIELNRHMNETLEAMARALFKDWFVDFRPTRAKAEGMEPYLPPRIWGMFPGALDDHGIPAGWAREKVGRHVVAEKGLSYSGAGLTTEGRGLPMHNLNSILEGGGYKNEGLKFYDGDYKPRHLVRPGDLIVANTEQGFDRLLIGYSSIVPAWMGEEGLFTHHLFKVQPRASSPLSTTWLHFAMSASSFGEVVRRYSNGTTVNILPRDAFERPEITVPPAALIQAFEDLVVPTLCKVESTFTESQVLAQLRDVLLPKLISGEIQASQAERAVKAVTGSASA